MTLAAEVIEAPGHRGLHISRGDYYRTLIQLGYDQKTADLFSFGPNTKRVEVEADEDAVDIIMERCAA